MGFPDFLLKIGLAEMDPAPEGAHPKQPKPRPEENRPPKEQNGG